MKRAPIWHRIRTRPPTTALTGRSAARRRPTRKFLNAVDWREAGALARGRQVDHQRDQGESGGVGGGGGLIPSIFPGRRTRHFFSVTSSSSFPVASLVRAGLGWFGFALVGPTMRSH